MRILFPLFLFVISSLAKATSPVRPYEPPVAAPVALPAEAATIVGDYEAKLSEIQKAHGQKVQELREATIKKLSPLQTKYTRDNKLDEAVAIRDKVRELKGVVSFANWRVPQKEEIGQKLIMEIVGSSSGTVWGTDVYTADSNPAAAAVHAGILKVGQKGIVEVEVLNGQPSYQGSVRNEISTQNYGPWGVSYKLQKAD